MGSWSIQDTPNHHLHRFIRDNAASSLSLYSQPVVGVLRQFNRDHLGHSSASPSLSPSPSASSIRILSTASSARPQAHPMPPKRTASGSPTGTPAKLPKQETKPETFSNSVKKRLQSSTRTGQACDRCKVRRIHPLYLAKPCLRRPQAMRPRGGPNKLRLLIDCNRFERFAAMA